jgi:hypothetical protein
MAADRIARAYALTRRRRPWKLACIAKPPLCLAVVLAALLTVPAAGANELASPRTDEVGFGVVKAVAPPGTSAVELYVGRHRVRRLPARAGPVTIRVPRAPGQYDLRLRFEGAGRILRRDESRRVWLLPETARTAVRERHRNAAFGRRLGQLGARFNGWSAFWVHDLRTGRTAGWNSDASFPAASTVKLAVVIAAMQRVGPEPQRSSLWPLIRDVATWSSNDASNRLLLALGGSEAGGAQVAQAVLRRIGAHDSTFTGFYRVETSVAGARGDAPHPLPLITYRRTTAHDLGRILFELHAASLGDRLALHRTGLDRHRARLALALLLSSSPHGDNAGLIRGAYGPRVPMAQKQGWTTYLRHTAAIVYGRRGPRIVVVLTYRQELGLPEARALGERFARAVRAWG